MDDAHLFSPAALRSPASIIVNADTKDKRRSLQIHTQGPRPLQLAAGSITGGSASSPPIPSSSRARTPLSPDTIIPDSQSATTQTPNGSRSSTTRRQSSMSYFSSNRPNDRDLEQLRTPLSAHTGAFPDRAAALSRSSSLNTGAHRKNKSPLPTGVSPPTPAKERPPLTLADKHAELLHFIAQKEAKCLELRSQLAGHEAELLQLKEKWKRIINRGLSSSPNPQSSGLVTSSSGNFYPVSPANSGQSTVVLDGIKEGVQGVSRFLAAGLESITQSSPVASSHDAASKVPRKGPPQQLQLGSSAWRTGHAQKESQSSSCTTTTTTSALAFSSASQRSSMTSTSSLARDDYEGTLDTGTTSTSTAEEIESDFGDFETGPSGSLRPPVHSGEQMLIVRDTGATPTMSPNPAFHSQTSAKATEDFPSDFDWDDDVWDVKPSTPAAKVASLKTTKAQELRQTSNSSQSKNGKPSEVGSLPGVSSIPGISTFGILPSAPNSWVENMGKKIDQIQKSSTFTKSQKRASILISDMSQSIAAVLGPSATSSPSSASQPLPSSSLFPPSTLSRASSSQSSLLDDDDEDITARLPVATPVLTPEVKKSANVGLEKRASLSKRHSKGLPSKDNMADEDDWNW